jgi:hypothetical protein
MCACTHTLHDVILKCGIVTAVQNTNDFWYFVIVLQVVFQVLLHYSQCELLSACLENELSSLSIVVEASEFPVSISHLGGFVARSLLPVPG